jgi:PEP-CTERM motif
MAFPASPAFVISEKDGRISVSVYLNGIGMNFMYQIRKLALASAAALFSLTASSNAQASIVWDWSFQGETGFFTTSGNAPGNVAAPGIYNLEDFGVTSSGLGNIVGSLLGGQYSAGGLGATLPYDFNWNGSAVTFWNMAGTYPNDVWLFRQSGTQFRRYIFGSDDESPQVGDAYARNISADSYGPVTVSVSSSIVGAVPEPASWAMMIVGFGFVGAGMRFRRTTLGLA